MDFKITTPSPEEGRFRPIDSGTKGRKQYVCEKPEHIVGLSSRLYFLTLSQANERHLWVFHPGHSRHFEVDHKALVDPAPDPEEG
eukprot:5220708-Pyramimonas_sp.AAC.1